jgi:hypothetical protein
MNIILSRFESKHEAVTESGCWLWTGSKNNKGYGIFCPSKKHELAHRISWQIANGPIRDGLCVLHKCDTPSCVNPTHLFLGTRLENIRDMDRKGRRIPASGELQGRSVLTEAKVREIRADTRKVKQIAASFCVGESAIRHVLAGRSWKNVA